jgi:uncharacterized membrane protein
LPLCLRPQVIVSMKPEQTNLSQIGLAMLGLFGSVSTLLCCALPALLVALGLGATVAGLTSNLPWLVLLSQHKEWLFAISLGLMLLSVIFIYRARNAPCPIDPTERMICQYGRKISIYSITISFILWIIGYAVAFHPSLFLNF